MSSPKSSRTRSSVPHKGGRLYARGRSDVLTHGAEHVADEAVGGPVGQPDLPSGPADPKHLARGLLLVRSEHHPQRGEHDVEGGVSVGQVLSVAHLEAHVKPLGLCTALGLLDQFGHVVYGGHLTEAPGGGDGRVAAAGRHVEDPVSGAQIDRLAQPLAHDDEQVAHHRVVPEVQVFCWRSLMAPMSGFGDRVSMVVLLCAVCSVGKRSAELLHPFISNVRTLLPGQGQRITQMNDLSNLIQRTSQDATSTHSGG